MARILAIRELFFELNTDRAMIILFTTSKLRIETVKFRIFHLRASVDGLVVMTWAFQADM